MAASFTVRNRPHCREDQLDADGTDCSENPFVGIVRGQLRVTVQSHTPRHGEVAPQAIVSIADAELHLEVRMSSTSVP